MTVLAQITDMHIDNDVTELKHLDPRANITRVLDILRLENIEALIITGDVAETYEGIDWFLEQVEDRGFQYHIILGNHDIRAPYLEKKIMAEPPYYATIMNDFLVLFMDSADNWVDPLQLAWLDEQLSHTTRDILLFIHHPVLDCGATMMDQKYPLQNRDEVLRILSKTDHAISLFCGHYHTEEVVRLGNVTQYVTPSTFYQLQKYAAKPKIDNEQIGYRILSIENGKLETEVRYLERV